MFILNIWHQFSYTFISVREKRRFAYDVLNHRGHNDSNSSSRTQNERKKTANKFTMHVEHIRLHKYKLNKLFLYANRVRLAKEEGEQEFSVTIKHYDSSWNCTILNSEKLHITRFLRLLCCVFHIQL